MPPKLTKRDFGNADQVTLETKLDNEHVSIDSILFPRATILKLAKQVLQPEGQSLGAQGQMLLSKDSVTVIQRASVVFVNHIYYYAKANAKKAGRKGVNPSDVMAAIEKAEFAAFKPILEEELENFLKRKQAKKDSKDAAAKGEGEGEGEDDDDEDEDNDEDTENGEGNSKKRVKANNGASKDADDVIIVSEGAPIDVQEIDSDEVETDQFEDANEEGGDAEEDDEVADIIAVDDDNEEDELEELHPSQRLALEQKELEGETIDEDEGHDDKDGDDEEEDD